MSSKNRSLDIALISAQASHFVDDFSPLGKEEGVNLRGISCLEQWGEPDLILLPGSMDIAGDYDILQAKGLTARIMQHATEGKWIVGICGGLQMMGRSIQDPKHKKYPFSHKAMLGLLALDTHYGAERIFLRLRHVRAPWGGELRGFETHSGTIIGEEPALFFREDGTVIGYGHDRIWGTYLHRGFNNINFRKAFLQALREDAPLPS